MIIFIFTHNITIYNTNKTIRMVILSASKYNNPMLARLTIIIIAHRFTALKSCDYIYCLNKGKIIEHGTWDRLSKIKDGKFNKMLKIQKLDDNKN